jgi:hypothetical protein
MNPIERHRMYYDIPREEAESRLRSRAVYGPIFRKSSLPPPQLYAVSYFDSSGGIGHFLLQLRPDNKISIVAPDRAVLRTFNTIEDLYNYMRGIKPDAYPIANNEDPKPVTRNARRRHIGSRKRKHTQRNRRRQTRRNNNI